jgi:hypothetical protein
MKSHLKSIQSALQMLEGNNNYPHEQCLTYIHKTNSVVLSPQANYTDCHLSAKFSAKFCG